MNVDRNRLLKDLVDPANGLAEGFFLGKNETGEIEARHARIFVDLTHKSGPTIGTDTQLLAQEISVMGVTDIVPEFVNGKTSRSIAEENKWNASMLGKDPAQEREWFIVQLVKWTIRFSGYNDGGGEVDAIEIDKAGIRWIARKSNCKKSE